jgi:WD40 repeat protein
MSQKMQIKHTRQMTQWVGIGCIWLLFSSPLFSQDHRLKATLEGHTAEVWSVAFSPDGKTLVSAGTDNDFNFEIRFWDIATGKNTSTFHGPGDARWCVATYSPDGKTVASAIGEYKVKLWDVATGKSTTLIDELREYAAPRLVFSPDGKILASGGQCLSYIKLWDVATGKNIATLKGIDEYGIAGLVFGPDGKTLASFCVHNGIKRWEVATGDSIPVDHPNDEDSFVSCVAFSPDCKSVVSGGTGDGGSEINFWNVATGKNTAKLKVDQTYGLCSAAFSPDGKTLAFGCRDKVIKLWDVAMKKEQSTLQGHTDVVLCVAFSPDGKMLASGSQDKTIKLWDLATEK